MPSLVMLLHHNVTMIQLCNLAFSPLNITFNMVIFYCIQGKPRAKQQLPDREPYYGTLVPPTTSKQIGTQTHAPTSKEMYRLEMTVCHRKKKTDLEHYYS